MDAHERSRVFGNLDDLLALGRDHSTRIGKLENQVCKNAKMPSVNQFKTWGVMASLGFIYFTMIFATSGYILAKMLK